MTLPKVTNTGLYIKHIYTYIIQLIHTCESRTFQITVRKQTIVE